MAETNLLTRASCEFVGTFLLTFSVGCNILYEPHYNAALSIGATLMVLVYALGPKCGGHFNPAVTLAVYLADEKKAQFSAGDVLPYMLAQVTGAVASSLCLHQMVGKFLNPVAPGGNHKWVEAGNVEIIFTCMLCTVILLSAISPKSSTKEYFGMAIGFALTAMVYAGGHVSGAIFNPAIGLACDIVHLFDHGAWSLVWCCYQFAGAIVAAAAYKFMHQENNEDGAKMFAEFMGTFFFVFTVICSGDAGIMGYTGFAVATSLAALVFAFGAISGGHLNPAVTMAVMCSGRGKCDVSTGVKYMFCQFLGAAAAGAMCLWTLGEVHSIKLWTGHSMWTSLFLETLFTMKLAFVVLAVATTSSSLKNFYGLAIGFCVFVAAPCILNPAVSMGMDFGSALYGGNFTRWMYWSAAQLIGGAVAGGLFSLTHAHEYEGKA